MAFVGLFGCAEAPRAPVVVTAPVVAIATPPTAAEAPLVPSDAEKAAWHESSWYTNFGKDVLVATADSESRQTQEMLLGLARAVYQCAVRAWIDTKRVGLTRPYETRFWLADAWNKVVRIEFIRHTLVPQNAPPTKSDVDAAIAAAIVVRDASDGTSYVDVAAQFVVEESDILRDLEYRAYEQTNGAAGVEKRVDFEMEADQKHVKIVPIPEPVRRSIAAREDYARLVPRAKDAVNKFGVRTAVEYAFDVAKAYLAYGQIATAKERLEALYREQCGINDYGFFAWEKLVKIAEATHDMGEAKRLADAERTHSCR